MWAMSSPDLLMVLQIVPGIPAKVRRRGQQQFGIGDNRRQRVVDVMRHAAGHLAQGAKAFLLHDHLLGAAQFIVGFLHAIGEAHLIIKVAALFLGGRGL